MTIQEFHYAFKIAMDRVDSLSNIDFNPYEVDFFLNEAQKVFINRRFSAMSNPKLQGVEASQKRIDDLSTVIVKYPLQPGITPVADSGVYELNLSNLLFPYFHIMSASADVLTSPGCESRIQLKFVQHDDYRELLKDPFNDADFEFIPYNFGLSSDQTTSSIYMYPNQYSIKKVYVEYIKQPAKMSLGTYTYIDGTTYPPTTSDLPTYTHNELVDIAVQLASLAVANPEYVEYKNYKANNNE